MPLELNICLKTFGLMVTQLRLLNKLSSFESIPSRVLHKAEIIVIIRVQQSSFYRMVYLYLDI